MRRKRTRGDKEKCLTNHMQTEETKTRDGLKSGNGNGQCSGLKGGRRQVAEEHGKTRQEPNSSPTPKNKGVCWAGDNDGRYRKNMKSYPGGHGKRKKYR